MLLHRPSGELFGLAQDAGMGWDPAAAAVTAAGLIAETAPITSNTAFRIDFVLLLRSLL